MTGETPGFWLFSLAIYGRAGVEDSCLVLQNQFDADVNILLWCCWLAWDHGHIADQDDLNAADKRVENWRNEVLKPLRQARMASQGVEDSYQALKEAELEAERHAQALIHEGLDVQGEVSDAIGMRLSHVHQAMRNYLVGWLGVEEGEASPHIAQILNGLKAL